MPEEIKRVSSSFPFHKTVASVRFNHFGNQVLANYNNDHIYLFDIDKNYSKYVQMKQAMVKIASEKSEKKYASYIKAKQRLTGTFCRNNEKKRKARSEESSRVSSPKKKRKTNEGEAVSAQTEEKSVQDEGQNVETTEDNATPDIDMRDVPTNLNTARASSAFTSLLSRISGLVSRMAEYQPANNNPNTPATSATDDGNQEEEVDVDSREEPQTNNNNAEEESSVFNINLEINETNEPVEDEPETGASTMPPLETTVTNVNFSEDEFRSISTAIASSNVSIDIPASRGDFSQSNNNDEPSDEASEASSTRFNLLGINNSIAHGKFVHLTIHVTYCYLFLELESCETKYAMKFSGHKNMVTMKNAEFLGPHQEFVVSGSDDGKLFIWYVGICCNLKAR